MAFFLRSPRVNPRGPFLCCMVKINGQTQFIHSAPIVMHDRCAHAEGLEHRSRELHAEWDAAKRAVSDDSAARGDVNPRTGRGWDGPTTVTPDALIDRLTRAGRAALAYRDPISTLAGPGWDLCWAPLYSDRPDAPACYVCGDPVTGTG